MGLVASDDSGVAQAVEALRAGRVIAYPTETVYGLGADPRNPAAANRLFEIKGRPQGQPVLLVAADRNQVEALTGGLTARAAALADAFWPGPLSLVVPCATDLDDAFRNESGRICIRVSADSVARRICEAFSGAITSTSANLSGQPPATTAIAAALDGVAIAVDDGPRAGSAVSTVFDPETDTVYREGAISAADLREIG